MPLSDRDYDRWRSKHPAICNCVECTKKRLAELHEEEIFDPSLPHPATVNSKIYGRGDNSVAPQRRRFPELESRFLRVVVKLCINLVILAGLGLLTWYSYLLFTRRLELEALIGSIILIIGIAVWVLLVRLQRSRGYRWVKPSFKLTTLSVIAVLLILTFAGVQPLVDYKDIMVSKFSVMLSSSTINITEPKSTINTQPVINILRLEGEIHNLVNIERQNYGFSVLEHDTQLANIARSHSEDMALRNYFSHYNPEGQGPTERAKAAGYNCYKDFGSYYYDGIAENIFQNWLYSSTTTYVGIAIHNWNSQNEIATSTVTGWMNSSGHRQNILNPEYSKEGIGVAISSSDEVYITQDFW